jgi:hypothetical protein
MKRRITIEVTLQEHEDDLVTVWIRDANHKVLTVRRKRSAREASVEIGAVVFEMPELIAEPA